MPKLVKWPSKVLFSRGNKEKKTFEYSSGGEKGEEVEVPQIDENMSVPDFMRDLINTIGSETEAKQIINRRVFAEPAIRDGQAKFKASLKKGSVKNLEEATKEAILAVRNYTPVLVKEKGAFITEAVKAKDTMDSLKEARKKLARGELTNEQYTEMLEAAFYEEEAA